MFPYPNDAHGVLETAKEQITNSAHNKVLCSLLSPVQLFATSWTSTHQGPLSMGFSRQQ